MNLILCLFFCFLRFNLVILDCGCKKANRNSIDDNKISDNSGVKNDYCLAGNSEDCQKNDSTEDMVIIPRGTYSIGTNQPVFVADKESPERIIHMENDFYMDKYEISNKMFAEFVEATNYVTEAERYNDSFIFEALLSKELRDQYQDSRVVNALWWYKVDGVNWKHPAPEMDLKDILDHPVVHVSWHDAVAYCSWKNKRLPTEAEWEIACRGGRKGKLFPWGDKLMPKNEHWMNIWQGKFPNENKADDGYTSTCPVDKFKQNSYGLYNIVGNVWEWTADLWDKDNKVEENPNRVKKGGSYLCHESYCYRYRCAARSQNTEDSSAGNLGFRCVKDVV